jgi:5-methyltetrahydropteroyltriglutamate--homocysteine methyltransferase
MRNSSERILTTHTGSLPRPNGLTELVFRKQEGNSVPPDELRAAAIQATDEVVAKQIAAGIDIVSDGEMNKPGFVNYVGERLAGFGGHGKPRTLADLEDLPEPTMALYGGPGGTHINMTACQDEVSYIGQAQVAEDIEHLRNALARLAPRITRLSSPRRRPDASPTPLRISITRPTRPIWTPSPPR